MSTDNRTDIGDQLLDGLKETLENIGGQGDLVEMKKRAKEIADVATELIREYPVPSVIGAAVLGFVIGRLSAGKK